MKSILTKKSYYLITHPDLCGYSVENFGDRTFITRYPNPHVTNISSGMALGGDEKWNITEENILICGNFLLEEEIKKLKVKKFNSFQCQDCGAVIGWLGRVMEKIFGRNHKCRAAS